MNDDQMELPLEVTDRRVRGKGKKPAMAHVNLRIPHEVLAYYKHFPNYTQKMRDTLAKEADIS